MTIIKKTWETLQKGIWKLNGEIFKTIKMKSLKVCEVTGITLEMQTSVFNQY